jgi:hypothetical protein
MKKLFITLSLAIISLGLSAQASANASQIKWTVVAKKTGANTAEVYFQSDPCTHMAYLVSRRWRRYAYTAYLHV